MNQRPGREKRACPICRGTETQVLFEQRFSEISESSLFDGYDVTVCRTCGFCFAQNLPEQQAFDLYYREMSKYEHQENAGLPSEFERRQFPLLAHFIQANIPDRNARILEIGCANGGLLNELKRNGYLHVTGLDPSPICARNASELYQIEVLTGAISDLEAECGPFDLIILVAVLEHIRDLDGSLRRIHSVLSKNGKVYIEVPDATCFGSSADAPFQEFSIEHINFFTAISLANLMQAHGFTEAGQEQTAYQQTDTHTGYAVRMIFQKEDKPQRITRDQNGEACLREYIRESQKVEDGIHEVVNALVKGNKPLVVWGAGTHTRRLLATSQLASAKIVAFVDSNPNYQGKRLNDIPIIPPAELANYQDPILVSSRIFQSEIVEQIESELKLNNKIYTLYEA